MKKAWKNRKVYFSMFRFVIESIALDCGSGTSVLFSFKYLEVLLGIVASCSILLSALLPSDKSCTAAIKCQQWEISMRFNLLHISIRFYVESPSPRRNAFTFFYLTREELAITILMALVPLLLLPPSHQGGIHRRDNDNDWHKIRDKANIARRS